MEIFDFWFDLGFSNPSENAQRVEIVYKGRFVKSEFTFADPILKK